jgi:hypothetical protein
MAVLSFKTRISTNFSIGPKLVLLTSSGLDESKKIFLHILRIRGKYLNICGEYAEGI